MAFNVTLAEIIFLRLRQLLFSSLIHSEMLNVNTAYKTSSSKKLSYRNLTYQSSVTNANLDLSLLSGHPGRVMFGVFCSIYEEGPDSRKTGLWDLAATLTPVGPGYDSLPLHREKSSS